MTQLSEKKCIPCEGGISPLKGNGLQKLQGKLGSGWQVVNEHHIEKEFTFPNFKSALEFTNKVGTIAETEGHHPDIYLAWGKVGIKIWTHSVKGLTENDFILAAKIEKIILR